MRLRRRGIDALNLLDYSPVAHAFSDEMKYGHLGRAASLLESLQRIGCASEGTGRLDGVPNPDRFAQFVDHSPSLVSARREHVPALLSEAPRQGLEQFLIAKGADCRVVQARRLRSIQAVFS